MKKLMSLWMVSKSNTEQIRCQFGVTLIEIVHSSLSPILSTMFQGVQVFLRRSECQGLLSWGTPDQYIVLSFAPKKQDQIMI